jgi:uncharacterized membrane protein
MTEPVSLAFYLALGALASVLLAVGLVMMKSRGEALPVAHGWQIPGAILAWIRDPVWIGGLVVQTAGFALYVVALSDAPVSMVAVMMQGGIALFVLFAVLVLGERARAWEWAGIAGIVAAMLVLGVSLGAGAAEAIVSTRTLGEISVASIALAVVTVLPMSAARFRASGTALAIGSGIAFGLGSLYTKALTQTFMVGTGVALAGRLAADPYLYLTIAANVIGLVMLQNSFHWARGIIAMPLSSALSNLVPIVGGMAAFGEHLPADPFAAWMRTAAFVITIAAGAMLAFAREPETSLLSPAPAGGGFVSQK